MWSVIPSMEWLLQGLSVVFTEPSFQTQCEVLLGWLLCLGQRHRVSCVRDDRGRATHPAYRPTSV